MSNSRLYWIINIEIILGYCHLSIEWKQYGLHGVAFVVAGVLLSIFWALVDSADGVYVLSCIIVDGNKFCK